jgi:hypothetical protein
MHSLFFYGYHSETSEGSLGIRLKDAVNVSFNGFEASGPATNHFTILGASNAVEIRRAYASGNAVNWIENSSPGGKDIPFVGGAQADYYYGVVSTFNSASTRRQN